MGFTVWFILKYPHIYWLFCIFRKKQSCSAHPQAGVITGPAAQPIVPDGKLSDTVMVADALLLPVNAGQQHLASVRHHLARLPPAPPSAHPTLARWIQTSRS